MKKLIYKIFLLVAVPAILIIISEAFIFPVNFFTYRIYEAISFNSFLVKNTKGIYYPNSNVTMVEEGDLGHHTDKAVKKEAAWRTDKYGYRNDSATADPDVL